MLKSVIFVLILGVFTLPGKSVNLTSFYSHLK